MSKKQFTIFMAIMLTAAVCTGIWIYVAFNPPARVGVLTVSSGENSVIPLSNVLEYSTGERKEILRPLKLADALREMPTLLCSAGLVVNHTEQSLDNSFAFALYTLEGAALYEHQVKYTPPEASGTYVVRIQLAWGNQKNNRIVTEAYFKAIYS